MQPYKNEAINKIYDLLFCDKPELFRTDGDLPDEYPRSELFVPDPSDETLQKIVDDDGVESRYKIIASNMSVATRKAAADRRIFGVIVEVGMDEGLDVLAAYEDGTARYINYSEKLIVWDARTSESDEIIADLFSVARPLVDMIGPWNGERREPPTPGNARLTFLVSNGLYFGEGPFNALHADALGGPVIDGAVKLMTFLIENAKDQSP